MKLEAFIKSVEKGKVIELKSYLVVVVFLAFFVTKQKSKGTAALILKRSFRVLLKTFSAK